MSNVYLFLMLLRLIMNRYNSNIIWNLIEQLTCWIWFMNQINWINRLELSCLWTLNERAELDLKNVCFKLESNFELNQFLSSRTQTSWTWLISNPTINSTTLKKTIKWVPRITLHYCIWTIINLLKQYFFQTYQ